MPLAFELTGGEASDGPQFPILLDAGPDIRPRAAMGDKGYDAKSNHQAARARGVCPVIPYRSNIKDKPRFFPKALYKGRGRIEQTMGKMRFTVSFSADLIAWLFITAAVGLASRPSRSRSRM